MDEVADRRAQDSPQVHAVVVVKARILPREQRLDEPVRDFARRNQDAILQPLALQTGVEAPVHVIDAGNLGHLIHLFHVEGARPDSVNDAHRRNRRPDDGNSREQGIPALALTFLWHFGKTWTMGENTEVSNRTPIFPACASIY